MSFVKLLNFIASHEHKTKWQIVFWLNAGLLLYLTLTPSIPHRVSINNIDKLFHFIGFGAFSFFCLLAYPKVKPLIIILLSCLVGILVEIAQSFIPYRGFSYADMLADFAGTVVAVGVVVLIRRQVGE